MNTNNGVLLIAPYHAVYPINSSFATNPNDSTSNFSVEVTGSKMVPMPGRNIRVARHECHNPADILRRARLEQHHGDD